MEDDLERQLLLADTAIADGQALLQSISAALAQMAKNGHDTMEALRVLTRVEEMLRRDLELRDRLRERLRGTLRPGPD
jgi:hypothetical protein